MTELTEYDDVIIIGGGLAGMLAASQLTQHSDLSVRVLEGNARPGGRADTLDKALNFGPHAFYRGGPFERAMAREDIAPCGSNPVTTGDQTISERGVLHPLPASPWAFLKTELLTFDEQFQITRFFASVLRGPAHISDKMTTSEWLASKRLTGNALRFASMLVRLSTYCLDHDLLSARVAIDALKRATHPGVLYLDGGWASLIDALVERARRGGATIQTGARVNSLREHGAGFTVTTRAGERYGAREIIIATPPRVAAKLLGLDEDHWNLTPVRAACLDLVLRGPLPCPALVLGMDSPTYAAVHSRTAKLVDSDVEVLHVARYLGREERATRGQPEAILDTILPDWRERIITERYCAMPVVHGLPRADAPRASLSHAPGIKLIGDWVESDFHMGDAVADTATRATEAILQRNRATLAG